MLTGCRQTFYFEAASVESSDAAFWLAPLEVQFGRTFRFESAVRIIRQLLPLDCPVLLYFDEFEFEFAV